MAITRTNGWTCCSTVVKYEVPMSVKELFTIARVNWIVLIFLINCGSGHTNSISNDGLWIGNSDIGRICFCVSPNSTRITLLSWEGSLIKPYFILPYDAINIIDNEFNFTYEDTFNPDFYAECFGFFDDYGEAWGELNESVLGNEHYNISWSSHYIISKKKMRKRVR